MKFTIELTKWEVAGITDYLKSVSPDIEPVISREDVRHYINDLIQGNLKSFIR